MAGARSIVHWDTYNGHIKTYMGFSFFLCRRRKAYRRSIEGETMESVSRITISMATQIRVLAPFHLWYILVYFVVDDLYRYPVLFYVHNGVANAENTRHCS